MRFICFDELKETKGIPGARDTIRRKEAVGRFPRRTRFGDRRYGWPESLIDAYSEALAAGHSEVEATASAERFYLPTPKAA